MTIDEKLQHFYEVSIDEAKEDAAQAIQAHKENLSQMLEEHKQSQRQTADAQIKAEAEHVRREVNKALSAEQITLKRNWSQKQEEMKQKFMQTPEYDDYLCRKITEASAFAEGDEIHIFLSAADKDRLESLKEKTGVSLTVSEEAFTGGIRAEIPGKNILIDDSFSTGLENMCKEFKFDGGLNHE